MPTQTEQTVAEGIGCFASTALFIVYGIIVGGFGVAFFGAFGAIPGIIGGLGLFILGGWLGLKITDWILEKGTLAFVGLAKTAAERGEANRKEPVRTPVKVIDENQPDNIDDKEGGHTDIEKSKTEHTTESGEHDMLSDDSTKNASKESPKEDVLQSEPTAPQPDNPANEQETVEAEISEDPEASPYQAVDNVDEFSAISTLGEYQGKVIMNFRDTIHIHEGGLLLYRGVLAPKLVQALPASRVSVTAEKNFLNQKVVVKDKVTDEVFSGPEDLPKSQSKKLTERYSD